MSEIVNPWAEHTELLPAHNIETLGGRTAWLQQRRGGIGSSDCSAVLGLNPWPDATPWHVFMDKTAQVPLDDGRDSEQMEIGREVESAIVRIVARRLGVKATTLPALANRDRPWQRSNVDAVLWTPDDGPVPFEAKNTSEYLQHEWIEQVPDHAELQILHTLAVTGAPYGYVGGMIGGRRVVFRRIDRDDELLDHITATEAELWGRVQRYRWAAEHITDLDLFETVTRALEPALTARDTVDSIVGASPKRDVDLNVLDAAAADDARAWLARYGDAQTAEKDAQTAKAEARNNLIRLTDGHAAIGDETVDDDGVHQRVIARVQRGVFAKSRFIEAHPEIADVTMKKIEVLDTDALKNEHPDLYRQFQSRSIRGPKKSDPQ